MVPRAGLDRCGKSRPTPGFDPRIVQPVASRYTDYATRPNFVGEHQLNWPICGHGCKRVGSSEKGARGVGYDDAKLICILRVRLTGLYGSSDV